MPSDRPPGIVVNFGKLDELLRERERAVGRRAEPRARARARGVEARHRAAAVVERALDAERGLVRHPAAGHRAGHRRVLEREAALERAALAAAARAMPLWSEEVEATLRRVLRECPFKSAGNEQDPRRSGPGIAVEVTVLPPVKHNYPAGFPKQGEGKKEGEGAPRALWAAVANQKLRVPTPKEDLECRQTEGGSAPQTMLEPLSGDDALVGTPWPTPQRFQGQQTTGEGTTRARAGRTTGTPLGSTCPPGKLI